MPFVDGIWQNDEVTETEPEPETPPATSDNDQTQKPITQSILLTIKEMLGISEECHAFDIDVIIDINAVFLTLNQLGIGPDLPYQITGIIETWADFLGEQNRYMAAVQTYTYMRVSLVFDPPANSFLVDSFQKQIQEFEWRFTVQPKDQDHLDYNNTFKPTYSDQNGSEEEVEEETPEEEIPGEEGESDSPEVLSIEKPVSLLDIFS